MAEHSHALADGFDVGREIISYRTIDELHCRVDFYIKHPEERNVISQRGREALIKRHAMHHRVNYMLTVVVL